MTMLAEVPVHKLVNIPCAPAYYSEEFRLYKSEQKKKVQDQRCLLETEIVPFVGLPCMPKF
jgi:hypothetical protein